MHRGAYTRTAIQLVLVAVVILVIGYIGIRALFPFHYRDEVRIWSAEHNLDEYLVAAVIHAESRFNPQAISSAGAIGLMQVTPATGKWIAEQLGEDEFSENNLYEPDLNIRFGTWYLRYLFNRFDKDLDSALIAYNAGPSKLTRWKNEHKQPFDETIRYVNRVKHRYSFYRAIYCLPILSRSLVFQVWR